MRHFLCCSICETIFHIHSLSAVCLVGSGIPTVQSRRYTLVQAIVRGGLNTVPRIVFGLCLSPLFAQSSIKNANMSVWNSLATLRASLYVAKEMSHSRRYDSNRGPCIRLLSTRYDRGWWSWIMVRRRGSATSCYFNGTFELLDQSAALFPSFPSILSCSSILLSLYLQSPFLTTTRLPIASLMVAETCICPSFSLVLSDQFIIKLPM